MSNSIRPFRLTQAESAAWEQFEAPLRASLQWDATWFKVCRRWFLYGGSKEFNPNFDSDIDRVVDYTCVLESILVPEHGNFISRRIRERATGLLALQGNAKQSAAKLLKDLYSIRSTLVHGSPLEKSQLDLLQDKDQWESFEKLVRDVMVQALRTVPNDDDTRRSYLSSIYKPSDQERADQLQQEFRAIKDSRIKQDLINSLRVAGVNR